MNSEPFQPAIPMGVREGDNGLLLTLQEQKALEAYEEGKERLKQHHKADAEARRELEKEDDKRRTIRFSSLDGVTPENVRWLWRGRIPIGEVTIVAGKGGIGKSLFLATLTAWITTGKCKGEYMGTPQNVVFQANEDSYEKTVVPRLLAAGADLRRVYRIDVELEGDPHSLMLPRDLAQIAGLVESEKPVAIIIDPLSSNMTDKDRNSPEVRNSYEKLRAFAERMNIAIIGNGHTRKGQSSDLLEALIGSSEIGNVIRAAIGIIRDPDSDDHRVILSQCKNNLGTTDLPSYTYRIVEEEFYLDNGWKGYAPVLKWGDHAERHVNDILTEPAHMVSRSEARECREWLRDFLTLNPGTERQKVVSEGAKAGFKEHAVKNAGRAVARTEPLPNSFPRRTVWFLKGGQ